MNIHTLAMRPHSILNTLSSIYYLCGSDPDKAKETMRTDIAVEKAATLVADAAVEVEKQENA